MEIQINNRQKRINICQKTVKEVIERVIKNETKKHYRETFELSVNFVDDKEIQKINKAYLAKDTPTDVISFALTESAFSAVQPDVLGDIFISAQTAISQAQQYKTRLNHELLLYIIHGVLHILKCDDIDPGKRKIMQDKENFYLNTLKNLEEYLVPERKPCD